MNSLWIEPPNFGTLAPSLAAAFVINTTLGAPLPQIFIVAYSIYSSWEPEEVYLGMGGDTNFHSPSIDNYVLSSTRDPQDVCFSATQSDSRSARPIRLDVDWANIASPSNKTLNQLVRSMGGSHDEITQTPVMVFGMSLSLLVTDALAKNEMDANLIFAVPDSNPITPDALNTLDLFQSSGTPLLNINHVDRTSVTPITFAITRHGYSYSTNGITRRISLGILLAHVFIALVHTAVMVWFGWTCFDLESICNPVICAIKSSTGLSEETLSSGNAEIKK